MTESQARPLLSLLRRIGTHQAAHASPERLCREAVRGQEQAELPFETPGAG